MRSGGVVHELIPGPRAWGRIHGPRAWGHPAGPCLTRVGARDGRSVPRVRHDLRPRRPLRVSGHRVHRPSYGRTVECARAGRGSVGSHLGRGPDVEDGTATAAPSSTLPNNRTGPRCSARMRCSGHATTSSRVTQCSNHATTSSRAPQCSGHATTSSRAPQCSDHATTSSRVTHRSDHATTSSRAPPHSDHAMTSSRYATQPDRADSREPPRPPRRVEDEAAVAVSSSTNTAPAQTHSTGAETGERAYHGPCVRGSVHAVAAHPQGPSRPKVVTTPRTERPPRAPTLVRHGPARRPHAHGPAANAPEQHVFNAMSQETSEL